MTLDTPTFIARLGLLAIATTMPLAIAGVILWGLTKIGG